LVVPIRRRSRERKKEEEGERAGVRPKREKIFLAHRWRAEIRSPEKQPARNITGTAPALRKRIKKAVVNPVAHLKGETVKKVVGSRGGIRESNGRNGSDAMGVSPIKCQKTTGKGRKADL